MIAVIVILGLPTRMDILPLPNPVLKYGGGILWAAMIYLVLAWVFNTAKPSSLLVGALMIAWGIEFSQLYHTDGLDDFRATLLGRMTIGRGFLWGDVLVYLIGISLAAWADGRWVKNSSNGDVRDTEL